MDRRPTADQIVDHLEKTTGHRFLRPELAVEALTHSSARDKDHPCNERFEFLGDSILGHVISEHLFTLFPHKEEGELSTMKSIIVSARTLSARSQELGFDRIVILGRGLTEKKGLPSSILGNVFESIVAAIYLDAGYEPARRFILGQLEAKTDEIRKNEHELNYKSLLQDYSQREHSVVPTYRVLRELGPDHRKKFQVSVEVDSSSFGPAWGVNKKEAEQRAARLALITLGLIPPGREAEESAEPGDLEEPAPGPVDASRPDSGRSGL
jgi:ribonuclease III